MKTNYLKTILMVTAVAFTSGLKAQDSAKKTAEKGRYENNYTFDDSAPGKLKEHVKTTWKGKDYEMKLMNGKLTELYVEGEKIPPAGWGKYSTVVAAIREQMRKDKIQAKKDQAQVVRDQVQARRDQMQAKRDQEQAMRDQAQAKVEQEQAGKDQIQAKRDQEQAARDQEQAKRDQEQAGRDQEQAKRDQEQAKLDQIQAKKDQEQAREDQRVLKLMVSDMVSDNIIPNEKGLHELKMNADEMIVNGKKMPDNVFAKYKEKYSRFAHGHSENGQFNGMSMHND